MIDLKKAAQHSIYKRKRSHSLHCDKIIADFQKKNEVNKQLDLSSFYKKRLEFETVI
jgi:hypothetical protein